MVSTTADGNDFILEAVDRELCCPVLQARFRVQNLDVLRAFLGEDATGDPYIRERIYPLDAAAVAGLVAAFGVQFDPGRLDGTQIDIFLCKLGRLSGVPYLVHSGYELPLLLDGRKKLARMYNEYPPATFEGEDRFDHWVAQGQLHREEVFEPFETPIKTWLGVRTVYYTPKGEEWRIAAWQWVWEASIKAGGWNEYFERLEGMLYGYEDWQNDWWIGTGVSGGGFGGVRLCCTVTAAGLAWIEAAGYRALPPVHKPNLAIISYDVSAGEKMRAFMLDDPDAVALVAFNVFGGIVSGLSDSSSGPPWHMPRERIRELNMHLRRSVVIAARRESQT
jgi:hypothetical protein